MSDHPRPAPWTTTGHGTAPDGRPVTVVEDSAPTRWGAVGYAVRSLIDDGHLEVTVTLPQSAPAHTWLRLRLPRGHRIESATLDGRAIEVDRAREAVRVTVSGQPTGPAHLLVTTGPDEGAAEAAAQT